MRIGNRIKEFVIRLSRWSRTRGFGVQSPTDYRFVREVIRGCGSSKERCLLSCRGYEERKEALMRRLQEYVATHSVSPTESPVNGHSELVTISLSDCSKEKVEMSLADIRENTIFVVENINHDNQTRILWQSIVADQRARTTYDLYHLGLALFEPKLTKMHYCVNL